MTVGSPIGKLFGESPIKPLQQHMQLVADAVHLLCDMLEAGLDGNSQKRSSLAERLSANHRAGLAISLDLQQHLPRGLFLATPRPDLLALIDAQQRVNAAAQRMATQIAFRDVTMPAGAAKSLRSLCRKCRGTVEHALLAIQQTDELLEAGFGSKQSKRVTQLLDSVQRRVRQSAMQAATLRRQLQRAEKDLSPVDAIFSYRIVDGLDDLAHATGEVGERLRLLLAH